MRHTRRLTHDETRLGASIDSLAHEGRCVCHRIGLVVPHGLPLRRYHSCHAEMRVTMPASIVEVNHGPHALNLIIGRRYKAMFTHMLRFTHAYRIFYKLQFALELVLAICNYGHHHEHPTLASGLRRLRMME